MAKTAKLGLCTGGGDCPGLNAVIRAVAKHAANSGFEVLGIRRGLSGLMADPPDAFVLAALAVEDVIADGGTVLGTNNQGSPFRKPSEAKKALDAAKRGWEALGLDALIVVGGDGTQLMAKQLVDAGLKVVGVPKTIDNDLVGTELTVGFQTATQLASDAALRLKSSALAHDRIMVLEVMGRDAGHIALAAGLAAGANAVLIPEIPFSYDVLAKRVAARKTLGPSAFLVVAAEGAAAKGGSAKFQESPTGSQNLGGIGHEIARVLHQKTGVDARATVLGHLQRGGAPEASDRLLGTLLGKHAVDLVLAKKTGRVVGVQDGATIDFPYAKLGDKRRLVDLKSEYVKTAEALGISLGRPSAYDLPL